MRRNIRERVAAIAPFLTFDQDPYLVVGDDGRLSWVMDAFTVSDSYPYSTHYTLGDSSINYIRNICAHHSRLWNRECRIKPMIARAFKSDLTPNDRVYAQLVIMQIMLAKIAPGNHWAQKLRELLAEHPAIPIISMGFPTDWASRKVWTKMP